MIFAMNTYQQQQAEQQFLIFMFGVWFFVAVGCAILGSVIGDQKNLRKEGALLGLLLGIFGLIIIAVMKDPVKRQAEYVAATSAPPGWQPDPYGQHEYRWWDGSQWSQQVSDQGVQSVAYPPAPGKP